MALISPASIGSDVQRRRRSPPDASARRAHPRRWDYREPLGIDGTPASLADAVDRVGGTDDCRIEVRKILLGLPGQRVELGTLECDGRPLRVVLVIDVGVARRLRETGKLTAQLREP